MEHRVTDLEQLPERMAALESQIVHFRAEVREDFSAVRQEMSAVGRALRAETADLAQSLRTEIAEVRHWTAEQDDETRRYMRILHEEVLAGLAIIQEGQASTRRPPRKNR